MKHLKYVELKSGYDHDGPAWIGWVRTSKSGQTVYFHGRALQRSGGQGIAGNHFDVETGEEYWVSGVKKDGRDRHGAGSGKVLVERSAVEAYLETVGRAELDRSRFAVADDIQPRDPETFHRLQNRKL